MSIYPPGVNADSLMFKFEVAALNLPVPDDLISKKDQSDWRNYMDNLSPGQVVRLYAQALDQFHQLLGNADPLTLPEDKQAKIYSKWFAASIANAVSSPHFHFDTEETYNNPRKFFNSDIGRGVYSIIAFLKDVNSADVPAWEDRLAKHQAIDRKAFLPFLNKFSAARKSAPGNAPTP